MPISNKISASINEADLATLIARPQEMQQMLNFLLELSNEEKQEMPKMRDKNVSWVQKCLEYAMANPSLVPAYIDVKEWAKDFKLVQDLLKVYRPLAQLVSQIDDTLTMAGSEAMGASYGFYGNLKGAVKAGVPGSKPIYEDLSSRFPGRPKGPNKE